MEIVFLLTGPTDQGPILELMERYEQRLKHYHAYRRIELRSVKKASDDRAQLKGVEAKAQLAALQPSDYLVLLDEKGALYTSRTWSEQLQKWMNTGPKRLVFCVGGAFGFDASVEARAQSLLSLSPMTLSHQLIRPVFLEQLYRGLSLLKGEPYHHD
ncbi:23S rRNA (pseudouridine(1915)-N(3))-methyltransferase RlmH [bacterium]|nr:23S rRNA (pseudouridine(1915)-N(3))-methyltransferase RlmH [bacterium]